MDNKQQEKLNQDFLIACADGNLDKIENFFINKEFNTLPEFSYRNYACLKIPCQTEDIQTVEFLLESKKIPQNVPLTAIDTQLFKAIGRRGYIQLIIYFLNKIEDRADYQDLVNYSFRSACETGQLETIKFLLNSKELKTNAQINSVSNDKQDSFSGLTKACQQNHLEVVKYLLESTELTTNANIKERNYVCFQVACRRGHTNIVRYFLNESPLNEHQKFAELIENGFFLNARGKNSEELLNFFIFEHKIQLTQKIKDFINAFNLSSVERLFNTRELEKTLKSNLSEKNTQLNLKNKKI